MKGKIAKWLRNDQSSAGNEVINFSGALGAVHALVVAASGAVTVTIDFPANAVYSDVDALVDSVVFMLGAADTQTISFPTPVVCTGIRITTSTGVSVITSVLVSGAGLTAAMDL